MKANSIRVWSRYYGLDHRQARRLRRRAARSGFVTKSEKTARPRTQYEPCMEDH